MAADISITKPHSLDKAEVKKRIDPILRRMKTRAGFVGEWSGDTYAVTRPAKGQLTVSDKDVRIELVLGLVLRPMRREIEQEIRAALDAAF